MDQVIEYKLLLKDSLSKRRYQHSLNVAVECRSLAEKYGGDPDQAYLAGLLHDCKKDAPLSDQRRTALAQPGLDPVEKEYPALWHAVAGAVFVREELGIHDSDLLNAIRYHTMARAGMSLLEKIVYVGDLISADRSYKDVDRMRKLAARGLDLAVKEALRFAITDLAAKGNRIPRCTVEAYNSFFTPPRMEEQV